MLPQLGAVGRDACDDEMVKALLTALNCPKGELERNTVRHIALLEEGARVGADIVVFPEMSLTGSVDPVNWPGHAIGRTHPAIDAIAAATERLGIEALVGFAELRDGEVHITQALIARGSVAGHHRKQLLGEDEDDYRVGPDGAPMRLGSTPIGVAICAEAAADAPFDAAARGGARVVFLCAAPGLYGRRVDEDGWRRGYEWWSGSALGDAARHARRLGLWIALSTQAGATADEDFPGLAAVVDPTGRVVSALPDWHEATLLATLP